MINLYSSHQMQITAPLCLHFRQSNYSECACFLNVRCWPCSISRFTTYKCTLILHCFEIVLDNLLILYYWIPNVLHINIFPYKHYSKNVYLHWCVLCHSELYTNSKCIAYCIVPINTKLCKVHLLQSAICSCYVLLRRNNYKKYHIRYKVQSSRVVLISILFEDKLKHSKQQWSWLISCQNSRT